MARNQANVLQSFSLYCLDGGILCIHRNYRGDIAGLGRVREPGEDKPQYHMLPTGPSFTGNMVQSVRETAW